MPILSEIQHTYHEKGYVALAREYLERFLQKDPQNFEALLVYVYHLINFSLYNDADQIIELAEPLATSTLRRRILIETKADRLKEAGDLKSAIELYGESHQIDPARSWPLISIGESQLIMGNRDKARELGERALACRNPDYKVYALYLIGLCHSQKRDYFTAIGAYIESLKTEPENPKALRFLDDAKQALTFRNELPRLLKVVEIERADEMRQPCLCRELCERFLEIKPNQAWVLSIYFDHLLELNLFAEALEALTRLQNALANNWALEAKWAMYYREQKEFILEKEACLRACAFAPTNSSPVVLAASAAFSCGDHKEAIRLAQRSTELNAEDDEASYNLGGYLLTQKRYEEARPCYLRALKINPTNTRYKTKIYDIEQTLLLIHEEDAPLQLL